MPFPKQLPKSSPRVDSGLLPAYHGLAIVLPMGVQAFSARSLPKNILFGFPSRRVFTRRSE
jgi:hypothetical protein